MKIAIPTSDGMVQDHFGHCEAYSIFKLDEDGAIISSELLPASAGCGCKSGIADVLASKGVKVLLAGTMGPGAFAKLTEAGIRVYRGCSGEVRQLALDYIEGNVLDAGENCLAHHHDQHHQCQHT